MQQVSDFFSESLNLGSFNQGANLNTWKAVAIIGLLFFLFLALAQVRRHMIDWSLKGAVFGIFFGFLLALILEGFLIIGGRTAITEIMGWKNAPKPLQVAIDSGRTKLVQVLGITDEIPQSFASEDPNSEDAINVLQSLDPSEIKKVKSIICEQ